MNNNKGHRSGGKFVGHTTIIEAAEPLVDEAVKYADVTKIALGIIRPVDRGAEGKFRVKFAEIVSGLLLTVRGNVAVQEVRIYTDKVQSTRHALCVFALSRKMRISFVKTPAKTLELAVRL